MLHRGSAVVTHSSSRVFDSISGTKRTANSGFAKPDINMTRVQVTSSKQVPVFIPRHLVLVGPSCSLPNSVYTVFVFHGPVDGPLACIRVPCSVDCRPHRDRTTLTMRIKQHRVASVRNQHL